jgi:hypothetical protein
MGVIDYDTPFRGLTASTGVSNFNFVDGCGEREREGGHGGRQHLICLVLLIMYESQPATHIRWRRRGGREEKNRDFLGKGKGGGVQGETRRFGNGKVVYLSFPTF